MVVVTGEGMELRPCSSSVSKHVVIYYFRPDMEMNVIGLFARIPVDRLISLETTPSEVYKNLKLPELPRPEEGVYLNCDMGSICTPSTSVGVGKALYFFGGRRDIPDNFYNKCIIDKVYCYDIQKLPEVGSVMQCKNMIYGMSRPLVAQVGTDIYVLGYAKTEFSDSLKPAFQKYNIKENEWYPLGNDQFVDMINNCECDQQLRHSLRRVPYVVIGRYLHVSVGNSSFTFDTVNNVWEDCKLFETFWSEREGKTGFSPTNIYGRSVYGRAIDVAEKKRKRAKFGGGGGGGPPFGFSGRGVLYDGNILLGIHYADNCPLVAFLFDDKTERVVRSQRLYLDELTFDHDGCLVDLGRDGYFCLVHFLCDEKIKEDSAYTLQMELLTFQISRLPKKTAATPVVHGDYNDDHFVECKFVRKEVVAKRCPDIVTLSYNAFCV